MNRIALILSAACFGRGRGQHPTHVVLRFDPDYDQFVNKVIGAMRQASDLCGLTLENLRARVSRRVDEDATFYVRTGSACRERLQLTQGRHAARARGWSLAFSAERPFESWQRTVKHITRRTVGASMDLIPSKVCQKTGIIQVLTLCGHQEVTTARFKAASFSTTFILVARASLEGAPGKS